MGKPFLISSPDETKTTSSVTPVLVCSADVPYRSEVQVNDVTIAGDGNARYLIELGDVALSLLPLQPVTLMPYARVKGPAQIQVWVSSADGSTAVYKRAHVAGRWVA